MSGLIHRDFEFVAPAAAGGGNTGSISAGTTRATLGEVIFSNSNGLSFGVNGQTVTGSYTVPTVTSWTASDVATSLTIAQLAFTNLNGITLTLLTTTGGSATVVGSHNALTSQSNQNVTAGNGGFAFQTLSFSNVNGFSFGTNAGSAITGSYTVPVQSNQTLGLYAVGNTTGQSSSSTYDARTLSFDFAGIISGGWSNSTFRFSATQSNQTLGFYASSNTTSSVSSGTFDARSMTFVGMGIQSVGYSNGSIILSVPAGGGAGDGVNIISAGTQSANTTGTVVFSNSNGVTFGMSNSSQVTASVGANATLSLWNNNWLAGSLGSNTLGNGTLVVWPMSMGNYLSASAANVFASVSVSSSSNSSHGGTLSLWLGIYTRNDSSLSLATSGSVSYIWTNTSSNSITNLTGWKRMSIPITIDMTPGNYWLAFVSRTTTVAANWITLSNVWLSNNNASFQHNFLVGSVGSEQHAPGFGFYSATTSAIPASIAFSQLTSGANSDAYRRTPYLQLLNFSA